MATGLISTGITDESVLRVAMADSNQVLTAAQAQVGIIIAQGALTAGRTVTLPDGSVPDGSKRLFVNDTSGFQDVTFKPASGTGVILNEDEAVMARSDGTNLTSALQLTANAVSVCLNRNTAGGIVVAHRFDVQDSAGTHDLDIVLANKERVIQMYAIKTQGAAGAANTLQFKNGANALHATVLDMNVADTTIVRATQLIDNFFDIAKGGTLRLSAIKAGGNQAALGWVICVRTQ